MVRDWALLRNGMTDWMLALEAPAVSLVGPRVVLTAGGILIEDGARVLALSDPPAGVLLQLVRDLAGRPDLTLLLVETGPSGPLSARRVPVRAR